MKTKAYRIKSSIWLGAGYVFLAATYFIAAFGNIERAPKAITINLVFILPLVLATAAGYRAVKIVSMEDRPVAKRFAWAFFFLLASESIRAYYDLTSGLRHLGHPSWADGARFVAYIFFVAALVAMARFSSAFTITKLRALMDVAVIVIIGAVAIWFFILRPFYTTSSEHGHMTIIVHAAFPVIDLTLVFCIVANLFGFKFSAWRRWDVLVASGLTLVMAADLMHLFQHLDFAKNGAALRSLYDMTWLTSYWLFFTGSWYSIFDPGRTGKDLAPIHHDFRWREIAVHLAMVVAVPTFMYLAHYRTDNMLDHWTLIIFVTILATIIVLRAGLIMAESSKLFSRSITDSLTGLFNHRLFQERLTVEIERAKRQGECMSLAVFDIDDFRRVNNLYGHSAGDRLLIAIGQRMRATTRISDTLCRIGGDEFALIMPQTKPIDAYKVCFKAQRELERLPGFEDIDIKVSIGIAAFPDHSRDKDDLREKADGALYWAKFHGKDEVLLYDADVVKTLNVSERIKKLEEQAYLSTVQALAAAVDARDPYTQYHSKHVSTLAALLAAKLGFDKRRMRLVETAALLHDIGKIGIADKILRKSAALIDEERKQIEEHPMIGQKILSQTTVKETLPWIMAHHERWDGSGYPQGLKEEEIPLEARILSLCDAYDAMTSDRPYRQGLPRDAALRQLREGRGTQFDPSLTDVFVALLSQEVVTDMVASTRS